jgi:hypothetical protein
MGFELLEIAGLVDEVGVGAAPAANSPTGDAQSVLLHYEATPPDQIYPSWLACLFFRRGVLVVGSFRWWAFVALLAVPFFVIVLAWAFYVATWPLQPRPVELRDLGAIAGLAIISWYYWFTVVRLGRRLIRNRLVDAESWLGFRERSGQLESRRVGGRRQLRLIRYSAVCPVCAGTVELGDGGVDFPGRVVGRCTDSPSEHVFSFDPVSTCGDPLRVPATWMASP